MTWDLTVPTSLTYVASVTGWRISMVKGHRRLVHVWKHHTKAQFLWCFGKPFSDGLLSCFPTTHCKAPSGSCRLQLTSAWLCAGHLRPTSALMTLCAGCSASEGSPALVWETFRWGTFGSRAFAALCYFSCACNFSPFTSNALQQEMDQP